MAMAASLSAVTFLRPGVTRADAVDEAYAQGTDAAQSGDWAAAARQFERARTLLATPSGTLEYDLGTSYAHLDQNGRAVFHLRRALRLEEGEQLREDARRNLSVTERRVRLRAETNGARRSSFEGWQRRLRRLLATPSLGWLSLAIGSLWCLVLIFRHVFTRYAHRWRGPLRATTWVLAVGFGVSSLARSVALQADPIAVVIGDAVAVREGAGLHHPKTFEVQAGSTVRLGERGPGWREIRLDDGLVGWIREDSLLASDLN